MIHDPENYETQSHKKERLALDQEVVARLSRAGEIISETEDGEDGELQSRFIDMFSENITEEMLAAERLRIDKRADIYELPNSPFVGVSHNAVVNTIISKRARAFWRNGLRLSEQPQDIDNWWEVVKHRSFRMLIDRSQVSNNEGQVGPLPTTVSGPALYEAVARVGRDDEQFLAVSAKKYFDFSEAKDATGLSEDARRISRGFVMFAINQGGAAEVNNGTNTHSGFNASKFLSIEIANLKGEKRRPMDPIAALARVEHTRVSLQTKSVFDQASGTLGDALTGEDHERFESRPFMRGASSVAYKTLDFMASKSGIESKNAKNIHDYLTKVNKRSGRSTVPSAKSLVILANQVTPHLNEALKLGDDGLLPLEPENSYDAYYALDRLFALLKYEAVQAERPDIEDLITSVAHCSLQLTAIGLNKFVMKEEAEKEHAEQTLLMGEPGPAARYRALRRAHKPGYGAIS